MWDAEHIHDACFSAKPTQEEMILYQTPKSMYRRQMPMAYCGVDRSAARQQKRCRVKPEGKEQTRVRIRIAWCERGERKCLGDSGINTSVGLQDTKG